MSRRVNQRMRDALEEAAQQRAAFVRGTPMCDAHLRVVMEASLNAAPNGFDKWTLWRALEIATANDEGAGDGDG